MSVRFTSASLGETASYATTGSAKTAVTRTTAAQYDGSSREAREAKNERRVRPQPLMQITKPLITKKTCTPRQPYANHVCSVGNCSRAELPQAPVTSPPRPP
jgi:hypothetical protein